MLCQTAITAMKSFGKYPNNTQRGIVVDYAGLPGAVPRIMLPLFGIHEISLLWHQLMINTSQYYSKGGVSRVKIFSSDSNAKNAGASQGIRHAAKILLDDSYAKLSVLALGSITQLFKQLKSTAKSAFELNSINRFWKELQNV